MGYRAQKMCSVCGKLAIARGLCRNHYTQAHKRGALDAHPLVTEQESFEARIEKTKTCWFWRGAKNAYGYGIFLLPGEKPVRAHRYAYELWKGKIPRDAVVMHSCDNPPCVNPAHLSIGTRLANNRDCAAKGRRPKGGAHWNSKLSNEDVAAIRDSTLSQAKIAKSFGISQSQVSRIRTGARR